jgi:uncharacterized protein (DUF2384 family)
VARVYVITEPEMQGLLDQLQLTAMIDNNHLIGGDSVESRRQRYEELSPDEKNRLARVHRAFHLICVRWAQAMGFKGGRF